MDVFRKIIGIFCMDDLRRFQRVGEIAIVLVAMLSAPVSRNPSQFKIVNARFAKKNVLINAG